MDDALAAWMAGLPQYEVSESMMTWMRAYDEPCRRACCFSCDCGSIGCAFKKKKLEARLFLASV
jgi:hypothetical protein